MSETEREQLEEINRELMVAKGDFYDLTQKLGKLSKKIFKLWDKIDEKLNET